MRKPKVILWYHPELDMLMVRWAYKYIVCHEGVSGMPEDMIFHPGKYGWVKIGGCR